MKKVWTIEYGSFTPMHVKGGLPSDSADFVWSEDAWCYVPDKPKLIAEAARIVRRGGRDRVHRLGLKDHRG